MIIHPMIALGQYLGWAERMRTEFAKLYPAAKGNGLETEEVSTVFMFYCYWLAAFCVVIEGYESIGLNDPAIDALLLPDKIAILKRYRNGVYHFQADYFFDRRFRNLFDSVAEIMPWLGELRMAAWKFYDVWSKAHNADGSPKV